ncbi:MAG: potassium uptake protein, TrkH family [Ruminococcaceae bacterium]|nr:potassium uptake protein, TrkH family [Oscillospiraceae bacterium]
MYILESVSVRKGEVAMPKKKPLAKRKVRLSPTQIIALTFLGIILLGALLLTLPAASRDGNSCSFLSALFTATSATCVTGLVMFDTWTQWSGFGQGVIISLIEIGGLGFMSAASLVIFVLRKRVGLKQRMVMAQALSVNDMTGVVRLQKVVLFGSLLVQLVGALILIAYFWPQYGAEKAVKWGVFHSISAFCNAGFDIFGCLDSGSSLIGFQSDPVVLLTLGSLVAIGGLGFFVWEEVIRLHSWKRFSVYTRLVLLMSGILTFGGAIVICLLEWNNPATLGNMPWYDKVLGGVFQSVTVRTAGFDAIGQGAMTDSGKVVSMLLMLVGGSSGSTAGGIKTVTVVVLFLFLWSRIRAKGSVCVFKHTVPRGLVLDAMTIVSIIVSLSVLGGLVICTTTPEISFLDGLYEAISALATVGLTTGITADLSIVAKIMLIIFMYFGRVGVLTLSLGFLAGNQAQERFRYANTNLLIG